MHDAKYLFPMSNSSTKQFSQNNKKIFLTGGSGLVGRNIREHPSFKKLEILAPRREELDLTDFQAVLAWLARYKPDIVIHADGLVGGITANMANPLSFLDTNTNIGRNVIMAARSFNIKKLVNLGSSCMYPISIEGPLKEINLMEGKLEPTNEGYALAKLVTMKLCQYVRYENPSLFYKTLIPCNLFGRFDNFDPKTAHLVASAIKKVHAAKADNNETVTIWGDGTARREFLYAGDLADAIFYAIEDLENVPDIMNIGTGTDYSVNEYYEIIADSLGWEGNFMHDLSKPVGMKRKLNSIDLQKKWGWTPKTSLRQGIKKTYKYFLERAN